ncbi:ImmA/IrrE family metallo-endopeptidase [Pelotomaculum propionicicum]|uniref:IrrE N-terminal-like domain-containing protein n=1 Tax=Pelotomaculum propionicicum TaxID=258475 RepID=A0A4Y7RXD0_9FIRM|nr:ImmA/IrrE family metallo-endopeptidase [Pelotomaculum propionicicum]TEB13420.1 hypothetical protein Pmgp_00314 [Pelotomaculum propionicicum]
MFLREAEITEPPINVIELIEVFGRIKWHEDAEDGFTIYDEKRGKYCIFIDPRTIDGRITWTMCHELAHIVLMHFVEYDMDRLTPREEKILDRECDIFVREFLMPEEWVLRYYEPPLSVPQLGKLKDKFSVSWEAVTYRFNELGICEKIEIDQLFAEWNSVRGSGSAYTAHAVVEREEPVLLGINYCLSNGTREVIRLSMPIKIVGTDNNDRFTECPICGNSDFSYNAHFCKICGHYLFNECLNSSDDPRLAHEECGMANASNALFCERCGSKTMLYEYMEKVGYSEDGMKEIAVGAGSGSGSGSEPEPAPEDNTISFNPDDIPF